MHKKMICAVTALLMYLMPTTVFAEETTKYVSAPSGLNYRTSNNVESEKIGALPFGEKVAVLEVTDNNWALVDIDGYQYYMSHEWLSDTPQKTYYGNCRITYYCPCEKCCGKWAGGNTASGTTPIAGRTVAMSGLPFGTKVEINGHTYTVEDRGVSGNAVDIFVDSHSEALNKGMHYEDVWIVN